MQTEKKEFSRPDPKKQKLQLLADIASVQTKITYFTEDGNKRARESWERVLACLEKKLHDLKNQ